MARLLAAASNGLSFLQSVQTGCGAYPVLTHWVRGVKQAQCGTDPSPASIAEVKKECRYTSITLYASMVCKETALFSHAIFWCFQTEKLFKLTY